MPDVTLTKLNESYLLAIPEDMAVEQNLYDSLSYFASNFFFHPKFKRGQWDGKIHLYDRKTNRMYVGLKDKLIEKLKELSISYDIDDSFDNMFKGEPLDKINSFLKNLNTHLDIYEHQIDMVKAALHLKRIVAISPTGSGKSFAYYVYIKYLFENVLQPTEQILLVVPTISLVLQMQSDFEEYDKKYGTIKDKIYTIMGGVDKETTSPITISTWQSIQHQHIVPKYGSMVEYFKRFRVIIMDEFHQYGKASYDQTKRSIEISESCINADWRLGATGTTDDWPVHHMVMEGLVGPIYRITKTQKLIEQKILSPLKIFAYIFKYPSEVCQATGRMMLSQGDNRKAYQLEVEMIYSHTQRNFAVCKIASLLKQNTLVLFTRIKHGQMLYQKICELTKGVNKVFYVDGSTSAQEREDVRAQMERDSNCICIASVQVFGVGINIKNIHNIISAAGSKSKIRVLQAIGRGLRIHEDKKRLTVIDIVDDLSFTQKNEVTGRSKTFKNFSLLHHAARLNYYKKEGFPFEEKRIELRR